MSQEFAPLAERIIEAVLEADPGLAGFAGDHRYDDRLRDFSPGAVAGDVAMLQDAANALTQVDSDELGPEEQVDHATLSTLVDRALFELTEVREHTWNPLAHNPGHLLYQLVTRPFAPPAERLASFAARCEAIPDALATARATLDDCPRVHLETAIGQFTGVAGLVRGDLDGLLAGESGAAAAVEPVRQRAGAALDEFVGWLRKRLEQLGDSDGRSPRLGRRLWEARLWHALDTEISAAEVLRRAQDSLDRIGTQIRQTAAELVGGAADDGSVRAALDRLAADHPDNATIVDLAKVTMAEATDFVAQYDLVTLVDDPCVVIEMPEFARGVAAAYCDPPGPLETAGIPTFYAISPTPADWPAERVESFYREYNNHMLRNLTVHEATPGHFLQLAHSRRFTGTTRARALGFSGPFVEGWAVYAEELMVDHGFGGPPVRMQQLKMQLRMTINAILDQLVHCEDLPEAEAMALMTGRGFQEEGEAAGKWRRALLTSAQLSTYFVGYTEVAAIAAARPAGTTLREWHDQMLAHGSPAPRHLRTLLLGG